MKLIILASTLFFFSATNAQILDSTKYYVTEAVINDEDYSDCYLDNGQYLTFYQNEDGETCLLNSTRKMDEFSCGRISGLKSEEIEEDESYGELITFRWYYHNSYDQDSGYALVSLKRLYRENGTQFSIKIITQKLHIIMFSGFTNEKLVNYEPKENSVINTGYLITKKL
jgi:hypothetical protein